jgi:mxaD protein
MKRTSVLVYLSLMLVASVCQAAAPILRVTKTITIDAPVAKVWDQVKDFGGLNTWHPAVESDKIVEGTDNKVGAVRVLTLKGGGTIKERLLGYDAAHHNFRYSILESVLPVSNYSSTFILAPSGKNKTKVTWSGAFGRKNTGPNPADNENDKTATDTISGVYQAGLDNLKKIVEGK